MNTVDATLLTGLAALFLVVACVITWAMTNDGWERDAIASGHAERVLVEGKPAFAWK